MISCKIKKKASISKDEEIKNLITQVEKFEKKLHELEERIQNIQDMKREEKTA